MKKLFSAVLTLFAVAAMAQNDTIGPLLGDIAFDQGAPYNNDCPVINHQRAVTGCVATAMAQVMTYWQYPACGTGSATYSGGAQGAKNFNYTEHPFDWDNILHTYEYTFNGQPKFSTTQAAAVANLMLACGASVTMDYSASGSGTQTSYVANAMKTYFGYDSELTYHNTSEPNWQDWEWSAQDELDAGRPFIWGGTATSGGHCFVIDGYTITEGEYWFHVNWGWGGMGNSWCKLNNLRYNGQNYSNKNCTMVVGIQPPATAIDAVEATPQVAEKRLVNGEVIILRDGVPYTVLGQRR